MSMAGLAIVMNGIALGALASRREDRVWRVGAASLLQGGSYAASLILSYRHKA